MKSRNIQVIDGAINSTYDVYQVPKFIFDIIFPDGTNIAFLDEVEIRFQTSNELRHLDEIQQWRLVYKKKLDKAKIRGIHGTLHLTGSPCNRAYFPTRLESQVKSTL